jgi:transcriptional regulator with XRE-family HTH domain
MKQRRGLKLTMTTARRRAGFTQAELAKLMYTDRSQVTRWETGTSTPTITTLEKLAEVTGHRLRVLLVPKKVKARKRTALN